MALDKYRRKRNFRRTPEPAGGLLSAASSRYVMHKHRARNLHYDLRLELEGVLKCWAIPKGPSLDPAVKRLAVHVEDHPLDYADFEGVIPKGGYGAGPMIVWDHGEWQPLEGGMSGYRDGKLRFRLSGTKLRGDWMLVCIKSDDASDNWLLIKEHGDHARSEEEYDVLLVARPESSITGRTIDELTQAKRKAASFSADQLAERCGQLAGIQETDPPTHIKPQLAKPTTTVPEGKRWLHEIKLDGYRLIAHKREHTVRLDTRHGHDWTDRFPAIAEAVKTLPGDRLILDGELVALQPDGVSSFQALQSAQRERRVNQLAYFVFDLLYFEKHDLRRAPLLERKELLKDLLAGASSRLQFCDHLIDNGPEFLNQCCERGSFPSAATGPSGASEGASKAIAAYALTPSLAPKRHGSLFGQATIVEPSPLPHR